MTTSQDGSPEPHKLPYLSLGLLGSLSCVLFILLGVLGVQNVASDRELIWQNALAQGYWIARSFEISHSMVSHDHVEMSRKMLHDLQRNPAVRLVLLLDAQQQVLMASAPQFEGQRWGQAFAEPPASGLVVQRRRHVVDMVFPAAFVDSSAGPEAPTADPPGLHTARWVFLALDMAPAYAHYQAMLLHKVLFVGIVLLFGTSVVFLLATSAALRIRDQAERLNRTRRPEEPALLVNVGLCTGPVLLGATKMTTVSGHERLTYTASGMVTNLAARLCALADHGDIYLSETTADLVGSHFTLGEPTSEHLKNFREAIRVYTLDASHSVGLRPDKGTAVSR